MHAGAAGRDDVLERVEAAVAGGVRDREVLVVEHGDEAGRPAARADVALALGRVGGHEQHRRGGDQPPAHLVEVADVLAHRALHGGVVELAQLLDVLEGAFEGVARASRPLTMPEAPVDRSPDGGATGAGSARRRTQREHGRAERDRDGHDPTAARSSCPRRCCSPGRPSAPGVPALGRSAVRHEPRADPLLGLPTVRSGSWRRRLRRLGSRRRRRRRLGSLAAAARGAGPRRSAAACARAPSAPAPSPTPASGCSSTSRRRCRRRAAGRAGTRARA